jgi:hypothetical protein
LWGARSDDGIVVSWLADDSNNSGDKVPNPDPHVSADVYLFGSEIEARLKNNDEQFPFPYWLRSPRPEDNVLIANGGAEKDTFWGVRPAFRFNPESVIFMSEINGDPKMGGTPAFGGYAMGGDPSKTSKTSTNYKLTILNSEDLSAGNVTVSGKKVQPGGIIEVHQSDEVLVSADGVTPWTSLTYKIVSKKEDGSREIVGYGQRIPTSLSTANSVLIDTAGLNGEYTVYVWAERYREKHSHEGSMPEYFTLIVSGEGGGGIPSGGGSGDGGGGGGGCEAGFGILTFLTALTLGFAVKRRR